MEKFEYFTMNIELTDSPADKIMLKRRKGGKYPTNHRLLWRTLLRLNY